MKKDTVSQQNLSKPIGSESTESFLKMVGGRENPEGKNGHAIQIQQDLARLPYKDPSSLLAILPRPCPISYTHNHDPATFPPPIVIWHLSVVVFVIVFLMKSKLHISYALNLLFLPKLLPKPTKPYIVQLLITSPSSSPTYTRIHFLHCTYQCLKRSFSFIYSANTY